MEAHGSRPFLGETTGGDNGAPAFPAGSKPVLDAGSGWDARSLAESPQQLFRQQPVALGGAGNGLDRLRLFSGSANRVRQLPPCNSTK